MPRRQRVRRAWKQFWDLLDSGAVVLFQGLFLAVTFAAGWYAVVADPIGTVFDAMGALWYEVWAWLNVLAPALWFAGVLAARKPAHIYHATWAQFVGDAVTTLVLLAFVTSIVTEAYWLKGTYGAYGYAAITLCFILLTVQDARELIRWEYKARKL